MHYNLLNKLVLNLVQNLHLRAKTN